MRDKILFKIESSEYASFLDFIGSSPELPASYEEWLINYNKQVNALAKSSSYKLKRVSVDFEGFIRYTELTGLTPSQNSLGAYAIYKSAQQF
jgi:hypothetical protein